MCWNCEGRVSVKEETCPYCGVSVVPASLDGSDEAMPSPFQALFSNYQTENSSDIPASPYAMVHSMDDGHHDHENAKVQSETEEEEEFSENSLEGFKKGFLAILFLLGGSMLFLFALSLALFSHQGVFTLSWDATLWFVYGGLSLPLLFLGWRLLSQLDEEK
jgi:hypothetical protein